MSEKDEGVNPERERLRENVDNEYRMLVEKEIKKRISERILGEIQSKFSVNEGFVKLTLEEFEEIKKKFGVIK